MAEPWSSGTQVLPPTQPTDKERGTELGRDRSTETLDTQVHITLGSGDNQSWSPGTAGNTHGG